MRIRKQGLPHPMFGFERRRFVSKRRAIIKLNGCPLAAGVRGKRPMPAAETVPEEQIELAEAAIAVI